MIQREEGTHAVRTVCRALGVSRDRRRSRRGYYAWRSRPESAREAEDRRLAVEVRSIHRESRGTYGAPRIHAELRARGVAGSKKRVARLMRETGVSRKAPRRRKRGPPTSRRCGPVRGGSTSPSCSTSSRAASSGGQRVRRSPERSPPTPSRGPSGIGALRRGSSIIRIRARNTRATTTSPSSGATGSSRR